MKTERFVILAAFALGLAVWFADTVLDYFVFYEGSGFWDVMVATDRVYRHELYIRCVIVAVFLGAGLFVSRVMVHRRRVEEALHSSRERFRALVEASSDWIWEVDSRGVYTYVSPKSMDIVGFSPEELLGRSTFDLMPPDEARRVADVFHRAVRQGRSFAALDSTVIHKNGTRVVLETSGVPILDAQGNVAGYRGVDRDVTERKRSEAESATSRQRSALHVERTPLGVIDWDLDFRVVQWNPAAETIFGYTRREALGRRADELIVPEAVREHIDRIWQGLCSQTGGRRSTNENIDKAGRTIFCEWYNTPLIDGEGHVLGVASLVQDVTEKRLAEQALRLDESRLETLLQLNRMAEASMREITEFALEEAVRLTRSDIGYLAFLNEDETILTMHAWSRHAMEQCAVIDKPLEYVVEETGLLGEVVRQRKPVITNDYAAPNPAKKGHPAGHVRVTRHMNAPIFEGERIVVVAGVGNKEEPYDDADVRQLTLLMQAMWRLLQRKRANHQREQLIAQLEAKNTELERFTYTVSHDLKSPLITIKGYLGLLREDAGQGNAEQLDHDVDRIAAAADTMGQLLDDLLALSRIGRVVNPPEEIQLSELTRQVCELLRGQAEHADVRVDVAPNLPTVYADPIRLREAVQNLIENAMKYMGDEPNPRIVVDARRDGDETVFCVRDNGIGIEPQFHEKIFGLFNQLDTTVKGSGIGLALVRRIIEAQGGRVWVESEGSDRGATFCFTLPGTARHHEAPTGIHTASLTPQRPSP